MSATAMMPADTVNTRRTGAAASRESMPSRSNQGTTAPMADEITTSSRPVTSMRRYGR